MDAHAAIRIAVEHLGRFSFFTRDNPYASIRAGEQLPRVQRDVLAALLRGDTSIEEWLQSDAAEALLGRVQVGCLPRDLQLIGDRSVAVTSVHAFIHAPVFWWVVSMLWCITAGRSLDPALDESVKGYRLHPNFIEDPSTSGVMFRDAGGAYRSWKRHIALASAEAPGEVLAANTVDVASFYYSVTSGPREIVDSFLQTTGGAIAAAQDSSEKVLTALLAALHQRYAVAMAAVRPRAIDGDVSALIPLPVGLPSSRILANLVVDLALADLRRLEAVRALAAYADDVVVLTPVLPEARESIEDYFGRLQILDRDDGQLKVPTAQRHAVLSINLEKSASSYSRSVGRTNEDTAADDEDDADEVAPLDPYLEADVGPEWGGPLRTVLRAPHRREREPRKLERQIEALVGDIGAGLDRSAIGARLTGLLESVDTSLFLRLRRYWPDLALAGIAERGTDGVVTLTDDFVAAVETLELPADAPHQQLLAVVRGLKASWIHAVALGLAAAMSEEDRARFAESTPTLFNSETLGSLSVAVLTNYATRIRRRGLIPPAFVSVPLSEFTPWSGPLVGESVFSEFVSWAGAMPDNLLRVLVDRIPRSVRFVPLHEACLAVHLWANPRSDQWLDEAIDIMRAQRLVRQADITDLAVTARRVVEDTEPRSPETDDARRSLLLRFAMPSLPVREDQLTAILEGDSVRQAAIVGESRTNTQIVVRTAAKRKANVLVLPEWSVRPEQLGWLMNQSRRARMLIVAGQAPSVAGGTYSNRIWIGLPISDASGRRACVVPPPREKRYLSPHEQQPLDAAGMVHVGGDDVPVYRWRGLGIASLICFEFADVSTRHRLRSRADLLTVSSWNRDWRYFDAIQDSTTRDNYCITFCVNTSHFPGTRITRPTRSEMAVVASVHGSGYPAVLTRDLDLLPVVTARAEKRSPAEALVDPPRDGVELSDYKPVPPVW